MPATELRASVRGHGRTNHSGLAFKRPCQKCAFVIDVVESFICESGLVVEWELNRGELSAVRYSVAVDTTSELDGDEDVDDKEEKEFFERSGRPKSLGFGRFRISRLSLVAQADK